MRKQVQLEAINPLTAIIFRELFREEALDLADRGRRENDSIMQSFYAIESAARIILVRLFHHLRKTEEETLEWPTSIDVQNLRSHVVGAIQYLTQEFGIDPCRLTVDVVISRADEILIEKSAPQLPEEIE